MLKILNVKFIIINFKNYNIIIIIYRYEDIYIKPS